jgi:6-hydroxynicotinate 3-monooxygenase
MALRGKTPSPSNRRQAGPPRNRIPGPLIDAGSADCHHSTRRIRVKRLAYSRIEFVNARPSVAIIGAGIAGLTLGAVLHKFGIAFTIYEQAHRFARVGAGVQLTPNAVKLLRGLGLEQKLRNIGFAPQNGYNREWDSGKITFIHPMGAVTEQKYGAPDLSMHRAELHAALASLVPSARICFDQKLAGFELMNERVRLTLEDGSIGEFDALIGADGVHSRVRELLFGNEAPRFTGQVAYRAVFKTELLNGTPVDDRVKWWGPDRHIVSYMINPRREEIYFIASTPEPDFKTESWSAPGDLNALMDAYKDFHPNARILLERCPSVWKWALIERDSMPSWVSGRAILIGDAAHPMLPYMAQGAASSMEDAVILARCLQEIGFDDVPRAFRRCEVNRKERTARIQLGARQNRWMRSAGATDTDWVYGYDAWNVPLY